MLHKAYFEDIIESIKNTISETGQTVIFLEAGHFDPRYGVSEFSKNSLQDALNLTKQLIKEFDKKVKVVLGILIDDLGLECSDTSCTVSSQIEQTSEETTITLPEELENILNTSSFVKRDRLVISSERTCKNRGLLKLKKLVKNETELTAINLVQEKEDSPTKVFFTDEESNNILLAEFSNSTWKAKCPTIMGQHYIDCFNKIQGRFNQTQKIILIDWTEMLDYSKVTAGSNAALKVFKTDSLKNIQLAIVNIFFGDNLGDIYEIKEFNHRLFVETK